jgi:hypothetical protein
VVCQYQTNPVMAVWPVVSHFSLNGLNKGQMDDQFMRLVNQLKKEPFLLKYQNTSLLRLARL